MFDLVNRVPIQGFSSNRWSQYNATTRFAGGIVQNRANDDLAGNFNVTSIALEVSIACLIGGGNRVMGGWTKASLPATQVHNLLPGFDAAITGSGDCVQISRLSNPLVNELVIGLQDKDEFNTAKPTQDGGLAAYVTNPTLSALLDLLFRSAAGSQTNVAPTNFSRKDPVTAFLTGFPVTARAVLHTFGLVAKDLAGFPNGRGPADARVDIALRVMMGAVCPCSGAGRKSGLC